MIFLIFALLAAAAGWLAWSQRAIRLVSGRRNSSKDTQQEYDLKKVGRYFGGFLFILAGFFLLCGILLLAFPHSSFLIGCAFTGSFIIIISGILYLNSGNKFIK